MLCFYYCNKYLRQSTYKEKRFILAHSFGDWVCDESAMLLLGYGGRTCHWIWGWYCIYLPYNLIT
jgi:hypothetical protein